MPAQSGVHVLHEAVEMIAPLLADRQFGEERVDEEGLATADAAPEVEAAQRRAHARQQVEAAGEQRAAGEDPAAQVVQARQRRALRSVERMTLGRECGLDLRGKRRALGVRAQSASSGRARK